MRATREEIENKFEQNGAIFNEATILVTQALLADLELKERERTVKALEANNLNLARGIDMITKSFNGGN